MTALLFVKQISEYSCGNILQKENHNLPGMIGCSRRSKIGNIRRLQIIDGSCGIAKMKTDQDDDNNIKSCFKKHRSHLYQLL